MPDAADVAAGRPPPATVRAVDAVLSWFVGSLAWWTAVFHVATPLGWHRDVAGGVWLGGLVVAAGGSSWVRRRLPAADPDPGAVRQRSRWLPPVLVLAGAGAAAISAAGLAERRPAWWAFWAAAVAVSGGAVWSVTRERQVVQPAVPPGPAPSSNGAAVALVVGIAIVAAIGSACTTRPDADDVFLVNRSTYVEEHAGPLPERDTLFSDEVFAVTRPDTAPTAIEPLVGVVAAWTPVTSPTVTYLLLGPLAAGLAVLALWRLLRTLGARAPALATAAAAGFLLLDGGTHFSFGNFHFARSWQGKVIFLVVVVPALWHHGLRWARDGSRRDLALLAAGALAGLGLTSTAAFVAPPVTLLVVVAGAAAGRAWYRVGPGLATTVPPALVVLAFAALPAQDADPVAVGPLLAWIPPWFTLTGGIDQGELWHQVLGNGIGLLVPAVAVLTAWAFVGDRASRLALALAPLVLFGLLYGPGTLDAMAEVGGVASILWRVAWVLPVPAAVGIVLTAPLLLPRSPLRSVAAAALPCVAAVAMVLGTTWVLDPANAGMRLGWPAWDVDAGSRVAAGRLVELSEPGDVVLAPQHIGAVVAIQTTQVRAVNPRDQYMRGRHAVRDFRARERRLASAAVDGQAAEGALDRLEQAVDVLGVDTACVGRWVDEPSVDDALAGAGLEPVDTDEYCTYWRRVG